MTTHSNYFEINQSLWNAKTKINVASKFYDVDSFLKGDTALRKIELSELPDLKDKEILHTQCHFGMDTLSLERMGAKCTGIDFSSEAITQARSLAKQLGLKSEFIESNVLEIDQHIDKLYDLVFTSYGVLIWLPDLNNWAKQLSKRLKKGGRFYMAEFHPIPYMFDWDSHKIGYNYFNSGIPYKEVEQGTYADKNADIRMEEYFWQHSFAEVFQALISNGFEIVAFNEYDYSPYKLFDDMKERADQEYIYMQNEVLLPMVYTIQAIKK